MKQIALHFLIILAMISIFALCNLNINSQTNFMDNQKVANDGQLHQIGVVIQPEPGFWNRIFNRMGVKIYSDGELFSENTMYPHQTLIRWIPFKHN